MLMSVLAACGGAPVSATAGEPGAKVLEGTAEGWTGEDAVVRAEAYDEKDNHVVLAKSPVSADGSFGLSLPGAEGVAHALITLTKKDLMCGTDHGAAASSIEMTPSSLEVASVALSVYPSSLPDTNDEDYLGMLSFENPEGSVEVLHVYAAAAATIRGKCTFTDRYKDSETGEEVEHTDTIIVDLNLVAGWNEVVSMTEEGTASATTVLSTGAVPKGLSWRYE